MANSTRSLPSHVRQPSLSASGASTSSTAPPPALLQRIAQKRAELDDLRGLRDLSATLADQMQALEDKLGTLSDGTEAVAAVLSNWHNVLRAIGMASAKVASAAGAAEPVGEDSPALPQTLVRIPAQDGREGDA